MFFYIFMHSSESILGVRKNFHSIYPSNVYTHFFIFFQKLAMISEFFFLQIKVGNYHFSRACCFFSKTTFYSYYFLFSFLLFLSLLALFSFSSFFLLFFKLFIICSFALSSFFFSLFLSEKVVQTRAHTTYLRLTTR